MPLFLCAYFIQSYSHKQITLGTFNLHVLCFYRQFKQFHYEDVEGLNVNFSKRSYFCATNTILCTHARAQRGHGSGHLLKITKI